MASEEGGEGFGLVGLATELIHLVALSGWLRFEDVCALALSCKRMNTVFVDDEYGRNIHHALLGVMKNVRTKRWVSAMYAVRRKWFVGGEEEEESVWRKVAEVVVGDGKIDVSAVEDLKGWENVILVTLSLPGVTGCLEVWDYMHHTLLFKISLLHIGATVGSERVVDWVMERGGDLLEVRNGWGQTPLWRACVTGHLGVAKKLVESGADVMVKDDNLESVLHAACQSGDVDVARYLLGLGVLDVEGRDEMGWTPLGSSCLLGHLDVVKLLVEEGEVDVNEYDEDGWTPLFWACREGKEDVVRYLLTAGADVGITDGDGDTPMDVAKMTKQNGVVRLLELWGARTTWE